MKLEANEPKEFDLEYVRQRVAEMRSTNLERSHQAGGPQGVSPFARRIAEQLKVGNRTPTMIIGLFRLFELASLCIIGLLVCHLLTGPTSQSFLVKAAAAIGVGALSVLALQVLDGYQIQALRSRVRFLPRVLIAWVLPFVILAAAVVPFGADVSYPVALLASWFAVGAVFLCVGRLVFALGVRNWARNGFMERRAVIVGGGEAARNLIRALEQQPDNDIRVCGIVDDRGEHRSPVVVAGYPKLGTVADLVEFARLTRIDMLIIAMPFTAEDRILQFLKKLWVLPLDIRLAAHTNKLRFRPRAYSHASSVPMLDIFHKPIRDWDSVAKRTFDIVFSVVALLLLWPVMVGAAIAVKATSRGPVIFVQKRHGFNNQLINVLKFRSMYTHMSDPTARNAVIKNDPRVTPVGRFLRRTSIDELPQLFNVLCGSLSLVGPRPHALLAQTRNRNYSDVVEGYFARHRVKPGITGWAQINGWRGEIDVDDKIKFRTAYDLYYIENWSLLFDLKILFLTPFRLFNTENAY